MKIVTYGTFCLIAAWILSSCVTVTSRPVPNRTLEDIERTNNQVESVVEGMLILCLFVLLLGGCAQAPVPGGENERPRVEHIAEGA